jgi:predicted nucleic acid-binding protein
MIVVDASVLVSYLVTEDVHHSVSHHWVEQQILTNTQLVAPILLLTEVGAAIARRTGDSELGRQAVARLHRMPTLRLVPIDQHLGVLATQLAVDLRLRGADAYYVAIANSLNIPLVTWDREQLDRARETISVHEPHLS